MKTSGLLNDVVGGRDTIYMWCHGSQYLVLLHKTLKYLVFFLLFRYWRLASYILVICSPGLSCI